MAHLQAFRARIEAFSKVRRGLVNAVLGYSLALNAVWVGVGMLLVLSGWIPSPFMNVILFLGATGYVVSLVVRYVRNREVFTTHLDEAFQMEGLAMTMNSRLVSALDFLERDEVRELTQVVIDEANRDLSYDFEGRLDRDVRNRLRKRFGVVFAVFVLLGLTPWFNFVRVARNIGGSFAAVDEWLFPVRFKVTPGAGRHVYLLGTPVEVAIQFKGRGVERVRLVERVGKTVKTHELALDQSGRAALAIKDNTESVHTLHFEFRKRKTAPMGLVFADYPVLENMQTELVYPAYTRMLPKPLEGVQNRLYCLEGTKITLGFTFSKELESARIVWDEDEQGALPLDVVGRFASTSIMHTRTRRSALQVTDKNGFKLKQPFEMDFEAQKDEKPEVVLPQSLKKEMPTLAEGLKLFGFGVRMRDDYGVSRCVLKWTKSTINNPTQVTQKGEVERIISPPLRKVIVSFQKVFEHVEVQPGDRISFYVEAYDNKPKAQMSVSGTKSLFVYQQNLEDLQIARLGFGSGRFMRSRLPKSKRATAVEAPMATRTQEKVWNEYEAKIDTVTKPPRIRGRHADAVKDYFRLMSTAVSREKKGK